MNQPVCRYGHAFAVVKVALSDGCICFPKDKEQWLCSQHLQKITPLGDATIIEDLRTHA